MPETRAAEPAGSLLIDEVSLSQTFNVTQLLIFYADGDELFQGDIIMTSEIRNSLRSRGILMPGDNSRGCLQDPTDKPQEQNQRLRRGLINTRNRDLRWPVGRRGYREVAYEITPSNCNYLLILQLFLKIPISSDLESRKKIVSPKILASPWGTPQNGLYGEASPERGIFFQASTFKYMKG